MKKIDYKRREFLSPNERVSVLATSIVEYQPMQSAAYSTLLVLRDGKDKLIIQRFLTKPEDAEELAATLARLQDHISALRGEIINLKFDENKQTNEPV